MARVVVRDVEKAYGTTKVIHGINVEIADGEFVVLVGPSGCGKSTLLRMIAGLEEISGGTISIGEREVNRLPPKDRDVAMVFQNYALYPHMTVHDNMAFSLKLRKADKSVIAERVGKAAEILNLTPYLQRYPRQLSGGQRDGPRHRARPAGLPVRRAAVEPRRQAARADAHRDQGAAPAPQDHDDLRHPRPDRGHDDGRPHRRDA
jgi:ABC-type nitrate/sulfonate/bicarbonate transport system ATPase subunit